MVEIDEASLARLRTDWVDVLLVHWPDAGTPFDETMRGLEEVVTSGCVRFVGVSNFTAEHLDRIMDTSGVVPAVNQIEINPFHQQGDAQQIMEEYHIQPEAWGPFAEGKNGMFSNEVLKAIGGKHSKSIAQIALRWLIQRGVVFAKALADGIRGGDLGGSDGTVAIGDAVLARL